MGMSSLKPIGIVMATRWEAAVVLRAFEFKKSEKNIFRAQIGGRPVILIISGVGMEPARRAAYRLCDLGAKLLLSTGFCGALVPDLKIGDLITDRLATVSIPVRTVAERTALAERASARAVDMETQSIVEAGTRRGVPIRIVRVVSDTIHDDLSPIFGPPGPFSAWKIAIRLLNPMVWPTANLLRKNSALAKQRLVEGLQDFFKTLPPE